MTGRWVFVSEDAGTISLHDCCIDRVEEDGADLALHFDDDGFNVTRDNPLNPTGRHRNTGPSAIVLENWRWVDGAFGRGCEEIRPDGTKVPVPESYISREQFLAGLKMEIMDFSWDRERGLLTLFADSWIEDLPTQPCSFCETVLGCDRLLFCWNGLPEDAWFQER